MRAMILAAGRGERMGAVTELQPKPLLKVADRYLIEYALHALATAGIKEIVINVSHHAEKIKKALGDGKRYGVSILYSEEKERLETGGGIFQALPLLGPDPFLVISSDIITDYPLANCVQAPQGLAHLVMVPNPLYHLAGDFGLQGNKLNRQAKPTYTFANIGIYRPQLFANCTAGHFRLAPLLFPAMASGEISGELYQGAWFNIGTPTDLAEVDQHLREKFS